MTGVCGAEYAGLRAAMRRRTEGVPKPMAPLVNRTEFRGVLKEVIKCLRQNLDKPGVTALTPDQFMFWLQNVTLEDIQIVAGELEAEGTH